MAAVNGDGIIMDVESQEDGLNGNTGEMSETMVSQDEIGMTDEDILNEALVAAPESFSDSVQLQYTDMADDSGTTLQPIQESSLLDQNEEPVSFMKTEDSSNQLSHTFTAENCVNFIENGTDTFIQQTTAEESSAGSNVMDTGINNNVQCVQNNIQQAETSSQGLTSVISQPVILTRQIPQMGSAPLGSSQNPIRIIQQGNQYTPVQQLSKEQLQQIMHVVQQQQSVKSPSSSVLFNTQTNTKIVYRVIYPSQLHRDGDGLQQNNEQTLQTPKRPYKKRLKEEEVEKVDGPELSKEEKEMRKKTRPKTRSGRVSKPPKHMVKDFKHIHVLDYDEDYDDSDGGYSDFKYSDGEEGEPITGKDFDENFVAYGMLIVQTVQHFYLSYYYVKQ